MSSENFQMVEDLIKNIKMRNVLGVNSELDKSEIKEIKQRDKQHKRYMENVQVLQNDCYNEYIVTLNILSRITLMLLLTSNIGY